MLYNYKWLNPGESFPPAREAPRIQRYYQNAQLFDGDHFDNPTFRTHGDAKSDGISLYQKCAQRITRIVGNFEEIISFPVLLNYQRLMTVKMADLVCGEYPIISGATAPENEILKQIRDRSDFDSKLYSTVLDISRYGDAIWRLYKDIDGQYNFTCWTPAQWYPIVAQDGTNTIKAHCLCWRENLSEDADKPDWHLHVQIHSCNPKEFGFYIAEKYKLAANGQTILKKESSEKVLTGLKCCAVQHLKAYGTTSSIYGYDDYMPIDSILSEIMTRVGQISCILDKHANPNMTGPVSMLSVHPETGEYYLESGTFYAVSPGEEQPKYLTWDGQLSSSFKQLEFLINQLYILSEMGAALLGGQDGSSQAISGAAMRFKMVNPLAKARRISNSLTRPTRQLFSSLSTNMTYEPAESEAEETESVELPIAYSKISVLWADGLPDDPRENIENCKLATGATKMMPLEKAIMEFFGRSNDEAKQWIAMLHSETEASMQMTNPDDDTDPNHPGPQDGTGVNPSKKGSDTGLKNFHGTNNK